jgi:hypothetical protein
VVGKTERKGQLLRQCRSCDNVKLRHKQGVTCGLTAVSMKMTDVWDVAPCVLAQIHRRFRGVYCLYYKHDHSSPASLIDIP